MAFVRLKKVSDRYYASKVESYREEGKVKQRTLENYGRVQRSFVRRLLKRKPSKAEVEKTVKQVVRGV